jgi:benzoylformate decarboxylase
LLAKTAFFEMLRQRRVGYVFGNPGTTELNFMEMFADYPDVGYVLGLQDAVPVGMAYGYAIATGEPAVVNLHITPGLANGLGNIFNAYRAKVPLVVTAGQLDRRMILQDPSLWSDLAVLAAPFTKWSYEAKTGADIPIALARAFKVASAPPQGPVFLSLPMDCLDEETPGPAPWTEIAGGGRPAPETVERVARALAASRDAVLIVGAGAATPEARRALLRIAEGVGARVYGERLPVRSAFPTDHPQYLGMIGLSFAQLRRELADADVVVLAGARKFASLLYTPPVTLPEGTTVVHVDTDPWEIGKNIPTTLGVIGDAGAVFTAIADRLEGLMDAPQRAAGAERAAAVRAERTAREHQWKQAASVPKPGERMTTAAAYRVLGELVDDSVTIVDEAITAVRMIDRYVPFRSERSYIGVASGSLGLGLPASLGAQLAWPDRRVICTVGDGSIMYTIQALWTAAHYRIPATIMVVDNRAYQVLKEGMAQYKGAPVSPDRLIGMDLDAPAVDLPAVARGFGVAARLVNEPGELREALAERSDEPRLLDVLVQ